MTQYIDKSALVAEIKRKISIFKEKRKVEKWGAFPSQTNVVSLGARIAMLEEILSFIDTLEVRDVDLEQELENLIEDEKAFVTDDREVKYYNGDSFNHIYELEFIAKHFFELGLNKAKGK